MTLKEILQEKISNVLTPLIDQDYILLDLPYYSNLGDLLIWEGEKDYLARLPHKCLRYSDLNTFSFPELSPHTIILLQGGGNFGDLWPTHQCFRQEVIKRYPANRIVLFPQSVWYNDKSLIKRDVEIMSRHKNLYLCARDRWSYDFMKEHFNSNEVLLLPDMAFCIDNNKLVPYIGKEIHGRRLYVKRLDKELDTVTLLNVAKDVEIRDWPTIEKNSSYFAILSKMIGAHKLLGKIRFPSLTGKMINLYADKIIRPYALKTACEFLAPYEQIVTTRLHVLILSVLLHKPCSYIDNTSGKLSAFASTWLSTLEDVKQMNDERYSLFANGKE